MIGCRLGFVKLFTDFVGHSIIPLYNTPRSIMCKMGLKELNDITVVVSKVVNYISSRSLNNREFGILLEYMNSNHKGLLLHNNVCWLSCGQILSRFVEFLEEI